MDYTLFIWTLINFSCCIIVTTSVAIQIYTAPILNEHIFQEFFERNIQATALFGLMEFISSIIMLSMAPWAWGPFTVHCLAIFVTCFSLRAMFKIIEGAQDEYETDLRRSNIIRGTLWMIRFLYLFILLVVYKG